MRRALRVCAVLGCLLASPSVTAQQPLTARERRIAAVILRLDRLVTLIADQRRAIDRELDALETEVEDLAR